MFHTVADATLDREHQSKRQAAMHRFAAVDVQAESAYEDLARLAKTLCATPVALVSLIEGDVQVFKARVGIRAASVPLAGSFCEIAIRTPNHVFEIPDAYEDRRFSASPYVLGEPFVRFYAGAPIVGSDGEVLGMVSVIDLVPRTLSAAQREGLRAIARQVRLLLELRLYLHAQRDHNAIDERMAQVLRRQHDSLRRRALHDSLTGLLNRAGLQELYARADASQRLHGAPYVFALADIDHFKRINDRHGHLAGDEVLRAVARIIAGSVRNEDVAVRYGGEEFLLIFPRTGLRDAHDIAERLCDRVRKLGLGTKVRLSVGLAAGNPECDSPEDVFERADRALYQAKHNGRDQVASNWMLS